MVGFAFRSLYSHASAQDGSTWLNNVAPTLQKVTDLPDNVLPDTNNVDCQPKTIVTRLSTTPKTICVFATRLGDVTMQSQLVNGASSLVDIEGPENRSFILPSTDPATTLVSLTATGIGNDVGVYRALSRGSLEYHIISSETGYYDITDQPSAIIRDPIDGTPIQIDTPSIAMSANGQWMVANLPHRGLMRVQMSNLQVQLFARPIEPPSFDGVAYPSLAISNDGRYVAGNTDLFGSGNLNVYDLTTCTDQLHATYGHEQFCNNKDILHGAVNVTNVTDTGLLGQQPDMIQPTHIRFTDNDNISFSARYAVQSGTVFKAAQFEATAPDGLQHKLGLLGLGDSYISGQGEFDYRAGTDTSNNSCHLSELSYPFIISGNAFDSYNSVACSGALTQNVIGGNPNYTGQVNDKIKEEKRNKQDILSNFLPGYIYQQEFASTYLPEAMVLSVGGDDIGFSDIVKSCVANSGGGTCYNTYEERAELVQAINDTYGKLVTTYSTLREQSGGARLYVVGYPQIAQADGNCGLNVHLNSAELLFSQQLINYLDSVVRQAAATAGVVYVDTQTALDGHKLYEAGTKAVNGLTVGSDAGTTIFGHAINFVAAESYHPTQLGHQLLANRVAQQTNNLHEPMPTPMAYQEPVLDPNSPFLAAVARSGEALRRMQYDAAITDDVTLAGQTQSVTVDGTAMQLQPSSQYQIVIHSTPRVLTTGSVDADGNIATAVTIPAETEPGYHTLHIYGQDMSGQDIDIQKIIYVAADATGLNPTTATTCVIVPQSGVDSDGDGVDDACDADITPPIATAKITGKVTVSASINPSTTAASNVSIDAKNPDIPKVGGHVLGAETSAEPNIVIPTATRKIVAHIPVSRVSWRPVVTGIVGFSSALTIFGLYLQRKP